MSAGPVDGTGYTEPADEPAPEHLSAAQAGRVATLSSEVVVVDGRPRYHSGACAHLLGRVEQRLPVSEATALGFTPCGRCSPGRDLLAATPPT